MPDDFTTKTGLDTAINAYVRMDAKPMMEGLRLNSVLLGMNNLIGTGGATGAETKVQQGANVTVSGTGTIADPYIVSANTGTAASQSYEDDAL